MKSPKVLEIKLNEMLLNKVDRSIFYNIEKGNFLNYKLLII